MASKFYCANAHWSGPHIILNIPYSTKVSRDKTFAVFTVFPCLSLETFVLLLIIRIYIYTHSIELNKFYKILQANKAHTAFLSPPVSTCINPACEGAGTLGLNHHGTDVVIFDMEGPTPATKISLKCTSCAMIYS